MLNKQRILKTPFRSNIESGEEQAWFVIIREHPPITPAWNLYLIVIDEEKCSRVGLWAAAAPQ